jgi:putative aldouronate transport system substrate-binding protein
MKKNALILLTLVLMFSLALSACSSKTNESINNNNEKPQKNVDGTKPEPAQEPEKKKLKLSFFLYGNNDSILPKGDDDFVKKTIEEKFNVELNVENIYGDEHTSKLNLKIASGDIPDLFLENFDRTQELSEQGVLADLTNYVTPEKMPNYFKWVTKKEVEQFQFPGVYNRIPRPSGNFSWAYYIREDWLDKLKLKAPTNYKELTEVMRAFTLNDPDGNNKNDTFGFTAWGGGKRLPWTIPQFKANGHVGTHFVDKDGNLRHRYYDPAIEQITADFRKWTDEGLVDPDYFINNSRKAWGKFTQGKVGMVFSYQGDFAYDSKPDSYYNQLLSAVPSAKVIPIHPFDNIENSVTPYMTQPILISSKASEEKIERIIDILDWMAGPDGHAMIHFGLEGKHHTRDGNKITLNPEVYKKEIIDNGNFLAIYNMITPEDASHEIGIEYIDPRISERDREIKKTIESFPAAPGLGIQPSTPDNIDEATLGQMRDKYLVQVLFDDPDTSKWPEYYNDLMNNYGGKELLGSWVEQMQATGIDVKGYKQ